MSAREPETLHTSRLLLRPWTECDAEALHAGFGDAETMRFWDSVPTRDAAEMAARIRESRAVDPLWHAAYALVRLADGRIVGTVNYHDRRPAHGRLAIGWLLLPGFRGQGLGREAARALMRYCFTVLGANRIEARIGPENAASLALAARLGFRREGLLREWMRVEGQTRDVVLLAVLKKDWGGVRGEAP